MIAGQERVGRRRPLWLVALLSVLTLGVYIPIWFGLTWAELRRETKDGTMMPLGHALAIVLPGVNAWVAWRHFKLVDEVVAKANVPARVDPMSAAIGVVIWWLTFTHYSLDPLFLVLDAVELAAGTAVITYGQRALNAYWTTRGADERLLETDLLAIAAAASYAVLTVVSFLAAPA